MPVILALASSLLLFVFPDRVSLCSTGYPGTHSVDQAGLQIRDSAASASWVLGLKSCTITAQLKFIFISGQPVMHKTQSQKTTNKHSRQGFCHTSCNNNKCIKCIFIELSISRDLVSCPVGAWKGILRAMQTMEAWLLGFRWIFENPLMILSG